MLWLVIILLVVAVLAASVWAMRANLATATVGKLFRPKPDRRLAVVEQTNIDGRRRLLLIRRDEIEHLIMTGGPVDVVIETGIPGGRPSATPQETSPPAHPAFARQTRTLGPVVNE
jgi:flagellar protein FliO/FliZ